MFKQIVSQLSMTPQAASQLTFYARRLKQESITRFFSAFAAALLVLLQIVAVVSPASASNSSSQNDLIPGGYTTKADLLSTYDANSTLRLIYTRFGVSRADIASSNTVMTTINSRQDSNSLKSVGHTPYGFADETKVDVPTSPVSYVYLRKLSDWDTGANVASGSNYKALVGQRSSDGGYFAIMVICGNVVVKTLPPLPTYACTGLTGSPLSGTLPLAVAFTATASVGGGDTIIGYRFNYGDGVIQDDLDKNLTAKSGHTYTKAGTYTATVLVNDSVNRVVKGSPSCSVTIKVSATPVKTSPPTVAPTAPPVTPVTPVATCKPGIPVGSAQCQTPDLACISLVGSPASGTAPLQVAFTATGSATDQTITDYLYDFGDNSTADSKSPSATHEYKKSGAFTAIVSVKGSTGMVKTAPACQFVINISEMPPAFSNVKTALNVTQNTDATKVKANGGDVIKYALVTKNSGGSAGDFITTDDLTDILEYANVTDNGGGTISSTTISWPSDSVGANQSVTHTFSVTVKNPVPVTSTGVSNPRSFDLNMDNVFGNAVRVPITAPVSKTIEQASATMPQTGAGTSILIIFVIGAMIFFFYLRNRQLVAEIKILRNEYQGEATHVS